MKFNINHNVRVRLTDEGREIHKSNFYRLYRGASFRPDYELVAPKEDAEGWSTWQLWDLMREFGQHMCNGCDVPFAPEIEIIEDQ